MLSPWLELPSWNARTASKEGHRTNPEGDHNFMNYIRAIVFTGALVWALGAPALQPQNGQSGAMQQPGTTQQTMPAPSGQPNSPAIPAQPGQTQTLPTQPSSPQSGPGTQSSSDQSQLDAQVRTLATELNLNPDQQAKARTILETQHSEAMTIIGDPAAAREDKIQKIQSLRQSTISKMRDILTAEQKPKFEEMVAAQNERIRQRQQQEPQSPNTAPNGATRPPR